jgi:GTP-binding protein
VDTAGIRRSRHLKENVDHVSVVQAQRSVERADVAIVVLDASEGMREMDAKIAGDVAEAGRGIVLAVNKWDLSKDLELKQRSFTEDLRDHLKFLPWAPVVFVSATSKTGLAALLKAAENVQEARNTRVTTGELNRLLGTASRKYAPKADKGSGDVKILFGTQVGVAPPTFVISLNRPVDLHFSYRRYLENQIREAFGFQGTPIFLKVRTRRH